MPNGSLPKAGLAPDGPVIDANPTVAWLAKYCREHVISDKWLLVEHLRVGQQWKDRLTQSGSWHINLHAKTMRMIVNELAAPWLAAHGLVPAGRDRLEMLVDGVLQDLAQTHRLSYFCLHGASLRKLGRLIVRTYNDWRLADLDIQHIDAQALEVSTKATDLRLIFQTTRDQLAHAHNVDYADCVKAVIEALQRDRIRIPAGLVLLQPEAFPLTKLERDLLATLRTRGASWHQPEPRASETTWLPKTLSRQVADGEVNEVRGVFQKCLASSSGPVPLDHIELIVSDYQLYAPLVLESLWQWLSSDAQAAVAVIESDSASEPATKTSTQSIDDLPITFAEGIACIYSRPGRLLRSWIRWINSDYLQSKAVRMLREGLLIRPTAAEKVGYARLASTLRRVPIGFGLDRYVPQIQTELETAQREALSRSQRDADYHGDAGSLALQALLVTIQPLITLASKSDPTAVQLVESARELIERYSRTESVVDRYARAKLLDDLDGMLALLRVQSDTLTNVLAWLEELPMQSRLFSSTPRPGCLHVAPLEQGGACGRPHVFIVGLDDRKFPRKQTVDPILLDAERSRISPYLLTASQLAAHQQSAVDRVFERMQGVHGAHIVCSHSSRALADDSECFASPILARLATQYQQLESPCDTVSFIAEQAAQALSTAETFQRKLLLQTDRQIRIAQVLQQFPRIGQQQKALACQADVSFGAYDGWVPQAGADLLATTATRPMSPSRLETLGTCPRKYFFARALGIATPDQWDIDPDRWLTPLDVGTLLHAVFEEFLRELQQANQTPDPKLHTTRLMQLLEAKIGEMLQRVPVHHPEAFNRQRDELVDTCEIFLQKEYEYARQRHARTWIMEAALGSLNHSQPHAATEIDTDQPIVIELDSGRRLVLCGRIDRIDTAGPANKPEHFIWDYKTGSDWGYDQADAIQQGRKLQPLLYTRMLATRLADLGRNPQSVRSFGYFFPNPRKEGLRYEWTVEQLAPGNEVLESMLDLLSAGTFIATNAKEDCSFCDYQRVCGAAEELVTISNLKTASADNPQLDAWRNLRT